MSDELIRERDFYRAKMGELNARVRSLEYDNAELVKRDQEISKRLADNSANRGCLLYTSDAADDSLRVDLGGRRIIKKKGKEWFD